MGMETNDFFFIKVDLWLIFIFKVENSGGWGCAGIEEFYEENFILKGYRSTRLPRR